MYFIPLPDESAFYPEAVDWYNRDMIYLLSGKEIYLLIKQRRALIEKSGVLNENITVFDGASNRFRIQEALQACATISVPPRRRRQGPAGRKRTGAGTVCAAAESGL